MPALLKPKVMTSNAPPRFTQRPSWEFKEGEEIAPGRFALRLLGGGSRYEAYLSFDEILLTTVVVKILRPHRAHDEVALDGLDAEYRTLRDLNHPVIARCFDATLAGPRPHLLLEFLEGPRLSRLLRRHGPLPMEQFVPLAVQMCSGLHYLHGRGTVHLDVKPSNIIMAAPPRLVDLSVARSIDQARMLKDPVGTDPYMAPEQCDPEGMHPVGPRADVWGLGVTLYESVTGVLPFAEGDPAAAAIAQRFPQVAGDPFPVEREVPRLLPELLKWCLAQDPGGRPKPSQLAEALEPLVLALPRRPVLSRLRPRFR